MVEESEGKAKNIEHDKLRDRVLDRLREGQYFDRIHSEIPYYELERGKEHKATLDILGQKGREFYAFEIKLNPKKFNKAKKRLCQFDEYMGEKRLVRKFYVGPKSFIELDSEGKKSFLQLEKVPLEEFMKNPKKYLKKKD